MNNIRYIKRKDLDIVKWDKCVEEAENGVIYAYSLYLDAMCDNWDALVMEDYKAVMPLPWRKKWAIRYIYQPAFMQRLGIFGSVTTNNQLTFYEQAIKQFRFIHFNVNEKPLLSEATTIERKNFFVELKDGYNNIRSNYSKECIKNISKANARGCHYTTDINVETVIQNFRNVYGHLNKRQTNTDYDNLYEFLNKALKSGKALLCGVTDEKGAIIYSAALVQDNKRIYYLIGSPTSLGRKKRAPYFFIDTILKKHSGSDLVFDFEGSDIPNVAAFYSKFTPEYETYYEVKINRLPWFIKWLKK